MGLRFKIFFGTNIYRADEKLNAWLEEHPELEVVDYRMHHELDNIFDHAIFITYKERDKTWDELNVGEPSAEIE